MNTAALAIEAASRKVGAIDKRIDAVRSELLRNETVADEFSAHDWQTAWDRHPVLRAIETSLFCRRYDASALCDKLIAKQARADELREAREYRKSPIKPCPTCGHAIAA